MIKVQPWSVAGKAWTGLAGSLLTFLVPWVSSQSANLPEPWPALIGAGVALLTAFGVYQAPYRPAEPQRETPWPHQ